MQTAAIELGPELLLHVVRQWPPRFLAQLTESREVPRDEPMIAIYGEFGIRLEDCIYMTEAGPQWFTQPSLAIDKPFA